jgi:hypothetical protein
MVLIDTFNYFPEGSAISETVEYGRQYLDITAQKAGAFKTAGYSSASTASVTLGTTNVSQGVTQDDIPDQMAVADSHGGRRALNTGMYFSVDDSLILGSAGQATVTIEYLDAGVGRIDLKYLDANGREVTTVRRITVGDSNSGLFKTATFTIDDAAFGNRLTFANDFWLDSDVRGGMVIRSVSMSIARACADAPSTGAGPTIPAPPPGYARLFLPAGFKRGCGS